MNKFLTVLVFFISVIYNQSLGQQNINIYNYIDLNDRDYQWCLGEYKSIMQGHFELVLAENNCKTREESLKFSNSRGSAWRKELNNRGAIYNGLYYTLLAQVPDSESVNWTIEGCEDNDYYIQQNINEKINSGFVPFGYLKEQGVVNVLYIGF